MRNIEVIVSPDGEVKIEAVGFRGNACEKATAALEQAMGLVKTKEKKKDWYVQEVSSQKAGAA